MHPTPSNTIKSAFNARDFVEMIDGLIRLRAIEAHSHHGSDSIDLIKRDMIDYLIATDPRCGIAVFGDGEKPV